MDYILANKELDQLTNFRLRIALKVCNNISKDLAESYLNNKQLHDLILTALNLKIIPIWFNKLCELIYKLCLSSCIAYSNHIAEELSQKAIKEFFPVVTSSSLNPHKYLLELLLCFAQVLFS